MEMACSSETSVDFFSATYKNTEFRKGSDRMENIALNGRILLKGELRSEWDFNLSGGENSYRSFVVYGINCTLVGWYRHFGRDYLVNNEPEKIGRL
jgi:hypothetical protein